MQVEIEHDVADELMLVRPALNLCLETPPPLISVGITVWAMSESGAVDLLLQEWREAAEELDGKPEEIKEQQDSFYKGSWDAARERAEPELKRKAILDCIDDLEESTTTDELLEALADWRKEADELDKRILDSAEWFRKSTIRHQLEKCIEEFEETFPDDNFKKCRRCGSLQKPVSDKRRSHGYRWECLECAF